MLHFLKRCVYETSSRPWACGIKVRSMTKLTKCLDTAEPKQKTLEFVATDIMTNPLAQDFDTSGTEITRKMLDLPMPKSEQIRLDKSPLPFEAIPGPAVLKIWEKYWKYVPIFGTQLVYSLLINNFTHGRLTWNTNVTPLKYFFNEYGPIVRINGPMIHDIVMIHRPEHIAQVFRQEGDSPVRSGIDILEHYRLNYRKNRLPGPFSNRDEEWLDMRNQIETPLADRVSQYFGRVDAINDDFTKRIRKIRNRLDETPENFNDELTSWAMECFSTLMFNKRLGFVNSNGSNMRTEASKVIEALTTAHKYLSKCETGFQVWRFFKTPYTKKLFEACDVIDRFITNRIIEAQHELSTKSSHDETENGELSSPVMEKLLINEGKHPDDISALLMDMIILGVQATANSLAFLLYFLSKNPRIQRKVFEEVSLSLPTGGNTDQDFEQLTYLKACIRECLRLRPAFPYLSRIIPKTITLHGYTIPKGTCLIMANEISSLREENFEDPEKFRPERWLKENSEDKNTFVKFSCLPFGHGVRSCLGKRIAEKQIMLLMAKLIGKFRIEYDYADIKSKYLMVNVPNRPLRFRFVDRSP